ncbi:MAG: hypothetical protein MZU97_13315 [Bacillus subtilis]|nr:hypothetical protein [Bacillus subtilis]
MVRPSPTRSPSRAARPQGPTCRRSTSRRRSTTGWSSPYRPPRRRRRPTSTSTSRAPSSIPASIASRRGCGSTTR